MSLHSASRFISVSVQTNCTKLFRQKFTTASDAEKFYAHLQKNHLNLERSLTQVNARLDSNSVNEVLQRCSSNQRHLGIRFFIWAGLQSNYRHSPYMYSKACEFFKISQNPEIVVDVVDVYRRERSLVSVKTFKVILNLCREARIANEALWVLKKMPELNVRVDTNAYNIVIRLFCEKGDMDTAQRLMRDMGLVDLYPDMITFISMIKGFCNAGRLEDACELLKVMKEYGCVPNLVVYSALVDGLCRFGEMEGALELLGEMEKEGGDHCPNVITYTSVIQRLVEKGKTTEGLRVFERMQACGRVPNRVTISTLINGLCLEGCVEEAYKLVDKVVANGSLTAGDCYSSLVVSLIRGKKLDQAEGLFRKMLINDIKPDSLACSVMIRELYLKGRVLDGFYICQEIDSRGFLSSIDSDIYSVLLVGLCQQTYTVEAAKVARLMLKKGVQLKPPDIDKIVEQLKKTGDKDLLIQLSKIRR